MFKRLAVLAAPALLLASLLPCAAPLLASTAPHTASAAPYDWRAAVFSPQTSVCDYANTLLGVILAVGFGSSELDPTGDVPLSAGDTPQSVLDQLQQVVATLKALTPPDGWADYHAQLVTTVEAFVNALAPAVDALTVGDAQTAHDVVTAATTAFKSAGQDLDQAYPDNNQQLNACS